MNTLLDLIAVTRNFRSSLIDTEGSLKDSVLVVDKAIGALTPPLQAPFGWLSANACLNEGAGQWELGQPLDVLLSDWLARHPGEYSGKKLALANFEIGRTIDNLITLEFRRTTWAQVRAFQEAVEKGTHEHLTAPLMKYHFDVQHSPIPNIAVVHAIVVTSDNMIVATQRGEKMQYHPLAWSLSLEEGLKDADFTHDDNPIKIATARGIAEELTGDKHLVLDEFVILSIAVEYPILNPAIVTFSMINIDSATLRSYWSSLQTNTKEQEVVSLHFIPCELNETVSFFSQGDSTIRQAKGPMEILHPTSRYRLLLATLHRFGLERTVSALKAR